MDAAADATFRLFSGLFAVVLPTGDYSETSPTEAKWTRLFSAQQPLLHKQ
jgi:hypothetical protein